MENTTTTYEFFFIILLFNLCRFGCQPNTKTRLLCVLCWLWGRVNEKKKKIKKRKKTLIGKLTRVKNPTDHIFSVVANR